MKEIIINLLITTYTICLPLLLKWVYQMRRERINTHNYMVDGIARLEEKIDEVQHQVDEVQHQVDDVKQEQKLTIATNSRYRIIRAADEVRNGNDLSEDHVEQLGEDVDIYKAYCDTHPDYKNHKGRVSMEIVLDYEKNQYKGISTGDNKWLKSDWQNL